MLVRSAVPIRPTRILPGICGRLLGWSLVLAFVLTGHWTSRALATTLVPLSAEEHFSSATAVFRGTVLEIQSFRDPDDQLIYTRTLIQIDEALKGKLPLIVQVIHRGGEVDGHGDLDGFNPQFTVGEQRLLFVSRRPNGTLFATQGFASAVKLRTGNAAGSGRNGSDLASDTQQGNLLTQVRSIAAANHAPGEDITDQAATTSTAFTSGAIASLGPVAPISSVTNLLLSTNAGYVLSSRFIPPDRGETIPYLVDATSLPTGITTNQALNAVSNALAAWTAVTSIKWKFEGLQAFPTNAASVTNDDGRLRLQLHDNFNYLPATGILGIGGRAYFSDLLTSTTWGTGGNVKGNEFHQTTRGYVVIKHTRPNFNNNPATLTEVLCHEIGHALSLAHTSENSLETNTVLKQSIMFFQAHADGRGAQLQPIDIQDIQQVNPSNNTPPYSYSRVMDIVTPANSASTNQAGFNRIELRGYDLQTTNLSIAMSVDLAIDGPFLLNGNFLQMNFDNPGCPFPCALYRIGPPTNSYWDRVFVRFSDGTNASPFVDVRVISLSPDSFPVGGDGLTDEWMNSFFGNPDPNVGSNHHPQDDADGDGLTNLQEYLLGTSPNDPNSSLKITGLSPTSFRFVSRIWDLYEVQRSTNLVDWTRAINPILAAATNTIVTGLPATHAQVFYRVLRVP